LDIIPVDRVTKEEFLDDKDLDLKRYDLFEKWSEKFGEDYGCVYTKEDDEDLENKQWLYLYFPMPVANEQNVQSLCTD